MQVLLPAIRLMQALAQAYPEEFNPHFQNTMDIILGWTLDAATAQDARDAITGQSARLPACQAPAICRD